MDSIFNRDGLFLINIDCNDSHIYSIDAKRCKLGADNTMVALLPRSYWCKAHEETP
jgi:hypothetical protein